MSAVAFDYSAWVARYPEFAATVSSSLATLYFNEACLYCPNTGTGLVSDGTALATILNMVTAHIAALNAPPADGSPASTLVGRISSATQGSVTVQAQFDVPAGSAQWFAQTKYGAAAWTAMAPYRTFRFAPAYRRSMGPYIGGFNRG